MHRSLQPNRWHGILALSIVLALGSALQSQAGEVDDGLDVYFRDADLAELSNQAIPLYPETDAGESTRLERAFPDAPPQIPHSVADMLPITANDNECLNCHHPDNATSADDAPLPKSHFQRAVMGPGEKGNPMAWVIRSYRATKDVPGTRYNCVMCHTPQATNVSTPASTFVAVKREAKK